MRGQTLFRTVRGAFTLRVALRLLYVNTNRAAAEVSTKIQLILAHQQYGDPSVLRKVGKDIRLMIRKLSAPNFTGIALYGSSPFDLVFDWNLRESEKHERNREDLEKRKQKTSTDVDRYSIGFIHKEVEEICEYGVALRQVVAAKLNLPRFETSCFQFASIRAQLPACSRIPAAFIFRHRLGKKEWQKKSRWRDSNSSSLNSGDQLRSSSESAIDLCRQENIIARSAWEICARGPFIMHRPTPHGGWVRFYDVQRGRETEMVLRQGYFEFKPIQFYERFAALVFGWRSAESTVTTYAVVIPCYVHDSMSLTAPDQVIQVLLALQQQSRRTAVGVPHPDVSTLEDVASWMGELNVRGCLSNQTPWKPSIHLGIGVVDALPRTNPLVLRVAGELPFAESERIQGKASNQLNGLKFTHGLVIQTKDANQGGILAESLKYPIVLQRFMKDGMLNAAAPVIIGFRELVFTKDLTTVGRLQAYAEWAFGTIVQRVMAKLGVRMHYGHPDFFSGAWVFSRSSLSKASATYNLSEDIFAGYIAMLRQRKSAHTDRIQDEKGRDTSLSATYTFTAKISQGAASQMKSRDIFELNSRLDFVRQFLMFQGSVGYYFSTSLMLLSVKMYLVGLLLFTVAGFSAENLGNLGLVLRSCAGVRPALTTAKLTDILGTFPFPSGKLQFSSFDSRVLRRGRLLGRPSCDL